MDTIKTLQEWETEPQRFYDERFVTYLEQGMTPHEAADQADLDLLEFSKPYPFLPETEEERNW
ncbi:MAG TPA: hypothetical protein VJ742_11965 [Nitrososphaera sp.]|nr:hypothetical protein [Nitrososphaera sp.]